jgi:hypothetical protein
MQKLIFVFFTTNVVCETGLQMLLENRTKTIIFTSYGKQDKSSRPDEQSYKQTISPATQFKTDGVVEETNMSIEGAYTESSVI